MKYNVYTCHMYHNNSLSFACVKYGMEFEQTIVGQGIAALSLLNRTNKQGISTLVVDRD